jgi:hypothetical protein
MKILTTAAGLALAIGVIAGVSPVAAQGNMDGTKYDKGATVTLQGCVSAAEKKDTYVLTGVKEWPVGNSAMGKFGPRMYWIDKSSKDLKGHLGHTVQLTGKVTDVEKSEMEIKAGESGAGTVIEIEGPGTNVVTSPKNAGVTTAARPNKDDIKITLLKLKIDDLKMMSSTCSTTIQ